MTNKTSKKTVHASAASALIPNYKIHLKICKKHCAQNLFSFVGREKLGRNE
jgi:hypothetical protein